MTKKEILTLVVYLLIFGTFGFVVGTDITNEHQQKTYDKLKVEYETLKTNYVDLDIDLHQQLRECENKFDDTKYDRYDLNRDGKISASDYLLVKDYIMNKD